MAGENVESIGLPPEAEQPPVEAPSDSTNAESPYKWGWVGKLLHITKEPPHPLAPLTPVDTLAGTAAGQTLPDAAAQVAQDVRNTEPPVLVSSYRSK